MNICILGYGSMGRSVEKNALKDGINITNVINDYSSLLNSDIPKDSIVIDFSNADGFIKNIEYLAQNKLSVVCGTTGWYNQLDYVNNLVKKYNIGFLYSSNFSIGMYLFLKMIEYSSLYIDKLEEYDVMGMEVHHKHKKDAPSGSAITIAETLIKNIKRKSDLHVDVSKPLKEKDLHFAVGRAGNVIGKHSVMYDSNDDTIELVHNVKSRDVFAKGSLFAAKWLHNKKGFYTIDNVFKDII